MGPVASAAAAAEDRPHVYVRASWTPTTPGALRYHVKPWPRPPGAAAALGPAAPPRSAIRVTATPDALGALHAVWGPWVGGAAVTAGQLGTLRATVRAALRHYGGDAADGPPRPATVALFVEPGAELRLCDERSPADAADSPPDMLMVSCLVVMVGTKKSSQPWSVRPLTSARSDPRVPHNPSGSVSCTARPAATAAPTLRALRVFSAAPTATTTRTR